MSEYVHFNEISCLQRKTDSSELARFSIRNVEAVLDFCSQFAFASVIEKHKQRFKRLHDTDLVNESGLSKTYRECADAAIHLTFRGRFEQANSLAERALELRRNFMTPSAIEYSSRFSRFWYFPSAEDVFADCLVNLGKYAEARDLLQTLKPVGDLRECVDCPEQRASFRRATNARALLGMDSADSINEVETLQFYSRNRDIGESELLLEIAYLTQRRKEDALQTYSKIKSCSGSLNPLATLFIRIPDSNAESSRQIADQMVNFLTKSYTSVPPDAPLFLDYGATVMDIYGFGGAASKLRSAAQRLRHGNLVQ